MIYVFVFLVEKSETRGCIVLCTVLNCQRRSLHPECLFKMERNFLVALCLDGELRLKIGI